MRPLNTSDITISSTYYNYVEIKSKCDPEATEMVYESIDVELTLTRDIGGFPAVGYNQKDGVKTLYSVGICASPNLDMSIEPILYPEDPKTK